MDRPIRRNLNTGNLPPPMRQSRYRRKGVKQSRTGCDECRRRKVKCDERIWLCRNCEKGGRECTWSRREQESATMLQVPKNTHAQTPLTPITNTGSPSATTATSYELTNYNNNQIYQLPATPERANSFTEGSQQVEHARQLVFRSYIDDFPILHDVLNGTLFQYEHLLQSTQAAASALIAATDQLQNSDPTRSPAIATNTWTAYDTAVSVFSTELQTATLLPTSGPLTCVFLMCLELITRRRQEASAHLMGLSRIQWAQRTHANFEERQQFDYLETALRCFEIHRMASSDRVTVPEIDPVPLMNINLATQDLRSLSQRVIEVVHASHCFISRSAHRITDEFTQFAVENERRSFSEAVTKTSDMISNRLQTETETQPYAHLLRLRCICLAMYIELETLFTKSETSYDIFAEQFQTIVVSAEAILGLRQQSSTLDEPLAFSLQLGIAQPLYLVAMKYRHSAWRKRACNCLNQVGQEGPWRGPLLAATAQRCAMVEEAQDAVQMESASVPAHQATTTMAGLKNWQAYFGSRMPREPQSVPEEYRIMTCRFTDDTSVPDTSARETFSFPNTAANMTETNIIFVQRSGEITPCSIRTLSTQELADSNASNLIVWSDFIRF